jgi:putative tricarboxylic transport membrane protein
MADRVILVCTFLVAAVYLYATTHIPSLEIGDPLGPKAFPRLVGIAVLLAGAMLALEMWKERRAGRKAEAEPASQFDWKVIKVLLCVVVWTGIYYGSLQKAGFIVATTVYLFPLMAWFHRGKWISNTLSAIGFSLLTYWLFAQLDVSLPKGFLPF